MLRVPGFVSAQRYRLSDAQFPGADTSFQYMTIYEIDGDPAAALAALREAASAFTRGEALHPENRSLVYELTGDRIAGA